MTEVPSVPDEFDSEKEVERYINRLRNQVEFLEEEIKYIRASLQEFVDRMESIDLHGSPSDVGLQDGLRDAF